MPEFIAQHIPEDADDFLRGYLSAAEWLLDDEIDRDTVEGWAEGALDKAREDCGKFEGANANDLEATNASAERNGTDFWLTRNEHGAGFWDRGYGLVGQRLSDAARAYSSAYAYLGDDNLLYFG